MLIHGTFSNTLNTFEGLLKYRDGDGGSELNDLIESLGFEQVLAFNHPTISADVFQNLEEFKKLVGSTPFKETVSIISASRGCMLAQAIGADPGLNFIVDKSIMFSPANGVGYFDLGKGVSKGLSVLSKITKGNPAGYIFALLQFSADYFLEQPGCQQMTFDSDRLNKVKALSPVSRNSEYIAVVNDWHKFLIDKKGKRFWMSLADRVVRLFLGKEHDFVVGERGQLNLPSSFPVKKQYMSSTHCKYFDKGELHFRDTKDEVDISKFILNQFK